jgi:hypothetical protein
MDGTCQTSLGSVLDLVRQSSIENYLRACLTAIGRNPEAVENALMHKS